MRVLLLLLIIIPLIGQNKWSYGISLGSRDGSPFTEIVSPTNSTNFIFGKDYNLLRSPSVGISIKRKISPKNFINANISIGYERIANLTYVKDVGEYYSAKLFHNFTRFGINLQRDIIKTCLGSVFLSIGGELLFDFTPGFTFSAQNMDTLYSSVKSQKLLIPNSYLGVGYRLPLSEKFFIETSIFYSQGFGKIATYYIAPGNQQSNLTAINYNGTSVGANLKVYFTP